MGRLVKLFTLSIAVAGLFATTALGGRFSAHRRRTSFANLMKDRDLKRFGIRLQVQRQRPDRAARSGRA